MTDAFTFVVPGDVVPWARARRGRNGTTFNDPRVEQYKRGVQLRALAERPRGWRLDRTYRVSVEITRSSWQRFDLDRAINSILDGLVGVAFVDDMARYVREVSAHVNEPDREQPETRVTVEVVE